MEIEGECDHLLDNLAQHGAQSSVEEVFCAASTAALPPPREVWNHVRPETEILPHSVAGMLETWFSHIARDGVHHSVELCVAAQLPSNSY